MINKGKYAVLLVDDSLDDRLFMRKALDRSAKLTIVGELVDGQEAIDYLKGEGVFGDRTAYPWPDIMLLDLKMPRKNGFDVLEWMKPNPLTMATVVVSGSWLAEDMTRSAELGAHGYFKKTCVREEEDVMIRSIEDLLDKRSERS